MNNQIEEKDKYVVTKVSLVDTLRNMPVDKPVKFDAETCGPIGSARSAACRLAQSGEGEWLVTSNDNGVTYIIMRKA